MKGAATNASRDPSRTVLHADLNSGTTGRVTADPRKPGEILNGWQSRLNALALNEADVAATFLQKVAGGLAHPVCAPIAQAVFNDLLLHEAYGLLADAFAAYNHNGTSPSSLTLRLPRDWVCTAPAARDEAFRRMRVQKLELVALPDSADKDPRQQRPLISAAACECAAVLLRFDATTELVVHGALASTVTLSRACAGSQLVSVELSDPAHAEQALSPSEMSSYQTLVEGLAVCSTLQCLTLGHAQLANVHREMEGFLSPGGPRLTSVKLVGHAFDVKLPDLGDEDDGPIDDGPIEIRAFMNVVKQFQTLTELRLHAFPRHIDDVSVVFLEPLKAHPSLTRLAIWRSGVVAFDERNRKALPRVIEFANTCPALTHFSWEMGTLVHRVGVLTQGAGEVMEQQRSMGADTLLHHEVEAMEQALKPASPGARKPLGARRQQARTCKLQSLTLTGSPLPPEVIRVFFQSLSHKQSPFLYVDLSGGYMEFWAALTLPRLLQNNATLRTFVLPDNAAAYYFLLSPRRIHGFEEAHAAARGDKGISPDKFRLKCAQYASNQEKQEAQSAFGAMGEQAQAVVTAPQVMLDQTQRQALMHEAFPELRRVVSQLLATQTGSLDAKGIEDVAGRVANYLAHSQSLSSIVHFSQVSTVMDHRKLRDPTTPDKNKTPDAVKQLVRLDNKARRETHSVNTVDAHGANNKLLEAARKNKVEDLRELRRQGAIDFRAQAQHSAPTFEALAALQDPAQGLTRTTTATTTLTTTTAISTTAAVAPDASEKTPIPPQG